jgi:hypothetical protein
MKIAVLMDDIADINPKKDSSLAMYNSYQTAGLCASK